MRANHVTENEVRSVPPVAPTSTWNPIHHSKVIDAVNYAIADAGLGIKSKRFELSTSGGNLFASYRLDQGKEGVDWQIGFRNSVEKKFAVGITAGTFTIVCSNLMFSGDYVEFRKHTKGLDMDELKSLAHRAIDTTTQKLQVLETWQSGLRMVPLLQNSMRALTFEAMHRDAFPASRFHRFLDAYSTEQAINGPTLLSFFGAVTRTIRDQSLTQISKRSVILNQLMDDFQGNKQSIGIH